MILIALRRFTHSFFERGKSLLFRPKREASRLWLGRGRIFQLLENERTFMVKDLPIKWNLMPEFFPLLGRAKVR
jgi:hypothetical protein